MNEIKFLPEPGSKGISSKGYQYSPAVRTASEQDLLIGQALQPIFENIFHRQQPMALDLSQSSTNPTAGVLLVYPKDLFNRARIASFNAEQIVSSFNAELQSTPLRLLSKESLTPEMTSVVLDAWRTEARLPDFTAKSQEMYGRIPGLHEAYIQWSSEELVHRQLAGEVLTRSAGWSNEQLGREWQLTQQRVWIPSFASNRQLAIYASIQEQVTMATYQAIAVNAARNQGLDQKTSLIAKIYNLIVSDEAFHGAWFKTVVDEFAKLDPSGTEQDLYFVLRNFYMPSDALVDRRGLRSRLTSYDQAIGMNRISMAKLIHRYASKYNFAKPEMLQLIAGRFGGAFEAPTEEVEQLQQRDPDNLADFVKTDSKTRDYLERSRILLDTPNRPYSVTNLNEKLR